MYAIRSFRSAAGAMIDGTFYPHLAWVIQDDISDAVFDASQTKDKKAAILEIVEVEDESDDALKPYGTVKSDLSPIAPTADPNVPKKADEETKVNTAVPTARTVTRNKKTSAETAPALTEPDSSETKEPAETAPAL